jgi:hypothetical protein
MMPATGKKQDKATRIETRERLGGLVKHYFRRAAWPPGRKIKTDGV